MFETIDIMLDIETLGIEDDAQVIQISAGAFHLEKLTKNKEDINIFNMVLDLSTLGDKLSVEQGTLEFWTSSPDNAKVLNRMLRVDNGITERIMVTRFCQWLENFASEYEEVRLWGNGIIFDNVKIDNLFKKYDIASPIQFYNHRDVRTIVELASYSTGLSVNEYRDRFSEDIEKHNAVDDVLYQIRYVTSAYQDLVDEPRFYWYSGSEKSIFGEVFVGEDENGESVLVTNPATSEYKTALTETEFKHLMGANFSRYIRREI